MKLLLVGNCKINSEICNLLNVIRYTFLPRMFHFKILSEFLYIGFYVCNL